jgi:hypothetical protein
MSALMGLSQQAAIDQSVRVFGRSRLGDTQIARDFAHSPRPAVHQSQRHRGTALVAEQAADSRDVRYRVGVGGHEPTLTTQ